MWLPVAAWVWSRWTTVHTAHMQRLPLHRVYVSVCCVCVCVRAWMYQIPLYWYRHTGLISTIIHGKRGSLEAVVVLVGAVVIVISQVDKCVEQPCSPFISILCSAPCFFCLQTSRLAFCSAAFARQVNISAVFKGDIFYKGRERKRRKRPPWLCRL